MLVATSSYEMTRTRWRSAGPGLPGHRPGRDGRRPGRAGRRRTARGLRPAVGGSTHPHWDHVLWRPGIRGRAEVRRGGRSRQPRFGTGRHPRGRAAEPCPGTTRTCSGGWSLDDLGPPVGRPGGPARRAQRACARARSGVLPGVRCLGGRRHVLRHGDPAARHRQRRTRSATIAPGWSGWRSPASPGRTRPRAYRGRSRAPAGDFALDAAYLDAGIEQAVRRSKADAGQLPGVRGHARRAGAVLRCGSAAWSSRTGRAVTSPPSAATAPTGAPRPGRFVLRRHEIGAGASSWPSRGYARTRGRSPATWSLIR